MTTESESEEAKQTGINGEDAHISIPPIPSHDGNGVAKNRFEADYHALPGRCGLMTVIEALLKCPASLVYEIEKGRRWSVIMALAVTIVGSLAVYGLVMGSFAGGHQYWAAPLKVVIGTFLSAALCLPSLYIFSSMNGGRFNLPQMTGLLALFVALLSLLEVGFAPIIWIFAQSTNGSVFMGFLHLGCWIAGWLFGIKLLAVACSFVNRQQPALLRVWGVLFLVVTLQMSTALRPLITAPAYGLLDGGKLFFTAHWLSAMRM